MRSPLSNALLPLLLASALAAGCSEPTDKPDAGTPSKRDAATAAEDSGTAAGADAAVAAADAASPGADAGPISSCTQLPADSCLSNLDCAAAKLCKSFSTTQELRCCVTGARGTGAAGDTCAADGDCAFGRCLERNDGARFCAGECTTDLECPGTMKCSAIFHWCYPRDAGAPPESCAQVSLPQCAYNDNCQDAERCENVGTSANEVLCCKTGARGTKATGAACASHVECAFGRCVDGLCSALCGDVGDPPCPSTMECNLIRYLCEPK